MNLTDPVISFPVASDCTDLKELKGLKLLVWSLSKVNTLHPVILVSSPTVPVDKFA